MLTSDEDIASGQSLRIAEVPGADPGGAQGARAPLP